MTTGNARSPIVLTVCLLLITLAVLPAAALDRVLTLEPASVVVAPGGLAVVEVRLDEGAGVAGFQFDLSYDPDLFGVETCERGTGVADPGQWGFMSSEPQSGRRRVIGYSTDPHHTALPAGSAVLARIFLRAAPTPGSCPLQLLGSILSDEDGISIPVVAVPGQGTVAASLVVEAGPNRTAPEPYALVQLEGAVSGGVPPYTVHWSPEAGLDNPASLTPMASVETETVFTLEVSDSGGAHGSDSVTVRINQPPVLDPIGNRAVEVGATLSFTVTGSDPEGDTLTFSASGLPAGASFDPSTQVFTWTPEQPGDYPGVTFEVSDSWLIDRETITITVGAREERHLWLPAASGVRGATVQVPVTIDEMAGVGSVWVEVSYDPAAKSQPAVTKGELLAEAWQLESYVNETAGTVGITLSLTDPGGELTGPATLAMVRFTEVGAVGTTPLTFAGAYVGGIGSGAFAPVTHNGSNTILAANQPPVLEPVGDRTVAEGESLTIHLVGRDPEGDPLTFSCTNLPAGAIFDPEACTCCWTPGYDQAGSYPGVCFTVSDGLHEVSEQITITVTNTNRPPRLDPIGAQAVQVGHLLTFAVSGSDPDRDPLVFSATGLPEGATFDPAGCIFAWTPTQAGSYTVRFTVSDGELQDSEEVSITVEAAAECGLVLAKLHLPTTVHEGHLHPVWVRVDNTGTEPCMVTVTLQRTGPSRGTAFAPQMVLVLPGESQKVVFPYRFSSEEMPQVTVCGTATCAHGRVLVCQETARVRK